MGALTSKVYSFRYRSWELQHVKAIDLSSPYGMPISIQKRSDKIIRILPGTNHVLNSEFITNQTRFSFDSELQNRLTNILNKAFYKLKMKKAAIYVPIKKQKLSEELTKRTSQINNLHVLLGKYIDMETAVVFKEGLNVFNRGIKTYFSVGDTFQPNFDFRSSYLASLDNSTLEVCDALFLIGYNPSIEEPLLSIQIKKYFSDTVKPIYAFGNISNSAFDTISLGNSITNLLGITLGKNKICSDIIKVKNPLILIGNTFFQRKDAVNIINLLKNLFTKIPLYYTKALLTETKNNNIMLTVNNKETINYDNKVINASLANWNGFIYLTKQIGTLNALDLGVPYTQYFNNEYNTYLMTSNKILNRTLYLVGVDNIKVNKDIYNTIIYQGSHGGIGSAQADFILPTVTPWARNGLYVNFLGMYHYNKKIFNKLSQTYSNTFPVYNFLINLANKALEKHVLNVQHSFFSGFRFRYFRYELINRILGFSMLSHPLVSPFQYFQFNNISNNNKLLISILKLEFEKLLALDMLLLLVGNERNMKYNFIKNFYHDFFYNGIKQKQDNINLNISSSLSIKLSTLPLNNPLINTVLSDNTIRSSLLMTLGWLRVTSKKNNFKKLV